MCKTFPILRPPLICGLQPLKPVPIVILNAYCPHQRNHITVRNWLYFPPVVQVLNMTTKVSPKLLFLMLIAPIKEIILQYEIDYISHPVVQV